MISGSLLQCREEQFQAAFGGFRIFGFSGEYGQAQQGLRGDAVARRRGIVRPDLVALDQHFVVVAGEEESAVLLVFEACQQRIGELHRKGQVCTAVFGLQQFQQRIQQKRMIVQIGVQVRLAVLVRRQQFSVAATTCCAQNPSPAAPNAASRAGRTPARHAPCRRSSGRSTRPGSFHRVPGGRAARVPQIIFSVRCPAVRRLAVRKDSGAVRSLAAAR